MKSIIIKGLLTAALLVPFTAGAVPIVGEIGIAGSLNPVCDNNPENGDTCHMDNATGLDFSGDQALVTFATEDFASIGGLSFGSVVSMTDFTFNPFTGVDPLWTAGGFSFAMDSLVVMAQTNTVLELRGTGLISYSDFSRGGPALDPTAGSWSFSADIATGATQFAWSSTTAPTPAPEPGILVLMGLGLIGGLGARRLTRS